MNRALRLSAIVALALLLRIDTSLAADDALFSAPRSAQQLIETVLSDTAQRLRASRTLQGQFQLRKHIRDIPTPLNASGDFVFARDLGIYWHTKAPFDSVFLLTPRGAIQRDEGSQSFRMDSARQPGVRAALEIFSALFALDVGKLSNDFTLYGVGNKGQWRIGLRPKSNALRSVFNEAIVSGGQQIERIEINDVGGDRTEITVRSTTASADAPDARLRALFAD